MTLVLFLLNDMMENGTQKGYIDQTAFYFGQVLANMTTEGHLNQSDYVVKIYETT